MERLTGHTRFVQASGNLSLLAAMIGCLALWGGITLLMTHPAPPQAAGSVVDIQALPLPVARWEGASEARKSVVNVLILWIPLGLGAIAGGAGVVTLAVSSGAHRDACRRALIALLLSALPGCVCTLWYLVFTMSAVTGR